MPSLLDTVSDFFTGSSPEQREHEDMLNFYQRVLREHPNTATGLPPPINIQVEERQVTAGRFRDEPSEDEEQTPETPVLAPPKPTISSVVPSSGSPSGGASVTINGTNFISGAIVKFGGTAATSVVFINDTKLTCVTPAHAAGQVDVVVENIPGISDFRGTLVNGFNYQGPPVVTAVSPAFGDVAGGTSVAISGANFVSLSTVTFGGVNISFTVISPSLINCVTPAHAAGLVTITVTNSFGDSGTLVNGFNYLAPPQSYFWRDGIAVAGVNPTPQGFVSGDIKLLRIAARLNGGDYLAYQGNVNVSVLQIGNYVAFNDSPDIDYSIPVVNGVAELYIQAFENDPGPDTTQSLQFTARDARYSGVSGDSPIYGVGNSSHIVGGRKHGGGGSGGVGSFTWADPTVDTTWHTNPFNWIGDRLRSRTLTITMKTPGGATDTTFNGTATVAVTYISTPTPSNGFNVSFSSTATFHNGIAQIGVNVEYRGAPAQQSYAYFRLNAASTANSSVVGSSPTCTVLNYLVP